MLRAEAYARALRASQTRKKKKKKKSLEGGKHNTSIPFKEETSHEIILKPDLSRFP
jgi:hypothetical protein